jgi:type II secretory pathway component GspD/PulD (secretin)
MPTLALFAVLMAPTTLPDDPPAPKRALVTKVFGVADIVGGPEIKNVFSMRPGQAEGQKVPGETNADRLVALVTSMVRPYSWDKMGGAGTAEFYDIGSALVVKNTPEVIQEVGDLLEALRRISPAKAVAPPKPLPAARPRQSEVIKLRNAAAADVAAAINARLTEENAVVVAGPVSNTLLVTAEPRLYGELVRLIGAIDVAPQQVVIRAMVMQVRAGFLADIGLTDDEKTPGVLTLTPRELNVLNAQIRHGKARGVLDILSRPQVQVADNQTGFVQVGQQYPYMATTKPDGKGGTTQQIEYFPVGVSMKVTPRFTPDGKVQMRVESSHATVAPAPVKLGDGIEVPAFPVQTTHSTVLAADGQTVVLRGLTADGGRDEILIVLTPHVVRPEKPKPAAEAGTRE